MVQVPYTPYPTVQESNTPTRPMQIQANPDMFGANIGRALQHDVAGGFEKIAQAFSNIQNMQDETTSDQAVTQYYLQSAKRTEDFMMLNGQQQKDGLEDHLKGLADDRDAISKNMTVNQKRMFDQHSSGQMRHLMTQSVTGTVAKFTAYSKNEIDSGIARDTDALVGHLDDPELAKQDIVNITSKMARLNQMDNIQDKGMREVRLKNQFGVTAEKVVTSILTKEQDPAKARRALELFGPDKEGNGGLLPNLVQRDLEAKIRQKEILINADKDGWEDVMGVYNPASPQMQRQTVPDSQTDQRSPAAADKRTELPKEITDPDNKGQGQHTLLAYAEHLYGERAGGAATGGQPAGNLTIDARAASSRVHTELLHPEFRTKLNSAIEAAEKATGAQAEIVDAYRDPKRQAQYYANYTGKPVQWEGQTYRPQGRGGLAAPPGQSRHQAGMAADLRKGAVLSKLHEWAESGQLERQFGLEFLRGRAGRIDPVHIQLARS
jgi:LAS superfamily LD-carboxypeptidase LdcB